MRRPDLLALGFMTLALFLGASSVIFPPSTGMAAGGRVWGATFGFLLIGVGLSLPIVVAPARVGGGIGRLTQLIRRRAGVTSAIAVYLVIGPLFATPRTAVVSFEMGVAPFTGDDGALLPVCTVAYFSVVLFLVLDPGRLVDRVGKVVTPVLLSALLVLGGTTIFAPAGEIGSSSGEYQSTPLMQGFLQGYLTTGILGALVSGIVIAIAIRNRGINDDRLVTRYSMIVGVIAATGLSLVYLALFYPGIASQGIIGDAQSDVQILTAYVQQTFGVSGSLLLMVIITLAYLTTAVRLIMACGEFFSDSLSVSYKTVAIMFSSFSLLVANQGPTQLISLSISVPVGLYPLAIVLIALGPLNRLQVSAPWVFVPVMIVALFSGITDGLGAVKLNGWMSDVFTKLPLVDQSLGWLLPVFVALAPTVACDRLLGKPREAVARDVRRTPGRPPPGDLSHEPTKVMSWLRRTVSQWRETTAG